jgi:methyl-accepting chemotaxis protein
LLAFKESVESARAGEQGKGFEVVAEEIGSLAQMSGDAADEISTILTSSISKVNTIVEESKKESERLSSLSNAKIKIGLGKVDECNTIFSDVVSEVAIIDESIGEIAVATREQSSGIHETSIALKEIDLATKEVSRVAQVLSSGSIKLTGHAESLQTNSTELQDLSERM